MDDLISRQAVIRWVKTECNPYGKPTLDFESGKKVIEHLKQIPCVQPDSRSGCWIVKEGETAFWDICNKCGEKTIHRMPHYKYCPYCGRRMEV